jgi:hypothetical protein
MQAVMTPFGIVATLKDQEGPQFSLANWLWLWFLSLFKDHTGPGAFLRSMPMINKKHFHSRKPNHMYPFDSPLT